MTEKDEIFYVGIRDQVELRKNLLQSSKDILDSLRRYEQYKLIKEEKLQYILALKNVFDELLVLNRRLRSKLPKSVSAAPELPGKVAVEEELGEAEAPIKKVVRELPSRVKSKLDILEEELAKVERRLTSLE